MSYDVHESPQLFQQVNSIAQEPRKVFSFIMTSGNSAACETSDLKGQNLQASGRDKWMRSCCPPQDLKGSPVIWHLTWAKIMGADRQVARADEGKQG